MAGKYCCNDVVPFSAMVAIECTNVGVNILFKAATKKGLSYYVFIAYSFAISTLILLLPMPFIFQWSRGLPPFKVSLIFKIFILGVIGFVAELCGYKGLQYTSPTLASALSNLVPAFTFIPAVFFRSKKCPLGELAHISVDVPGSDKIVSSARIHDGEASKSTQAKILGTTISILGALTVVLYKGSTIVSSSYPQQTPDAISLMASSSQRNWILGGSLLAVEYLLVPVWYIVQASIMKQYPAEVIVVFLYNLCGTLISAPVCLLLEANLSAWKINPDITLIAIIYSGVLCTGLSSLVHTWGLHLKGPLYISIFKPLSIATAATLSVVILGDALYLGTVVGAVILTFGFYAVIWGKAKEDELSEDFVECRTQPSLNTEAPLLQSYIVEDNRENGYSDC